MMFTKEKAMAAHRKLGFNLFNKAILKCKALHHEIGQCNETGQIRAMRDLEKEYDELMTVVHKQSK